MDVSSNTTTTTSGGGGSGGKDRDKGKGASISFTEGEKVLAYHGPLLYALQERNRTRAEGEQRQPLAHRTTKADHQTEPPAAPSSDEASDAKPDRIHGQIQLPRSWRRRGDAEDACPSFSCNVQLQLYRGAIVSFRFHQCRWGYHNLSMVEDVVENYRSTQIPLDVIWNDDDHTDARKDFTLTPVNCPRPKLLAFLDKIHKRGMKFTKWVPPPVKMTRSYVEESINRSRKRMDVAALDMLQFHCLFTTTYRKLRIMRGSDVAGMGISSSVKCEAVKCEPKCEAVKSCSV
ncbi:alpha-glucosidase [Hordeum vulgare]|nr:alpha-glucosidase [Hordeum vulgare]